MCTPWDETNPALVGLSQRIQVPNTLSGFWDQSPQILGTWTLWVCHCRPQSSPTIDSEELEHGCRMTYAGSPSVFALGLEGGDVPTFWLPLYLETPM